MAAIRLATILLLTSLAGAQGSSTPQIGHSNTPIPKLPVIDDNACPGPSRRIDGVLEPVQIKLENSGRIYSSFQRPRVSVAALKVGEKVSVLSGVNVISEPDKVRVLQPSEADEVPSLKPGDEVLGYGLRGDGNYVFWAKGVWFTTYYEYQGDLNGGCGFRDKSMCSFAILEWGIQEWWVRVKTIDGTVGWALASRKMHKKSSSDVNFGQLCMLD
jgi:hypothetical protein